VQTQAGVGIGRMAGLGGHVAPEAVDDTRVPEPGNRAREHRDQKPAATLRVGQAGGSRRV
jgi:hypothetical protein